MGSREPTKPRGFHTMTMIMARPKISMRYSSGVEIGAEDVLQEFHFTQQLGAADHQRRRNGDTDQRPHAAENHDGKDDGRFQEDEGFRRDEALAHGKEGAGKPAEHRPCCKCGELCRHRIDAERAAGNFVFAQRFPGTADRHAAQADGDERRQQAEREDQIEQEDLVIGRRHRQREGLGKVVRRTDIERPDAEDRSLCDARDTECALGDGGPVDQHQPDDFPEGQRHDCQVVTLEPQNREAEDHAPKGGKDAGQRQEDPEGQAEMRRQQCVGIGTHRIEGDIAEVEQAGETDDDVQTPGQHHINQDLDAEIIHPFQRALEAEQSDHDGRIDDQDRDCDQAEIAHEEVGVLDRRGGFFSLSRCQVRPDEGDRQETADCGNDDEDCEQSPALNEDQFVENVLVGLQTDEQHEETESDEAGIKTLAQSPRHQVAAGALRCVGDVCHGFIPSRLPADPKYPTA